MGTRENIAMVGVAAAAVLLQLVLAPYIAIAGAVPNFIAVVAVLVVVARSKRFNCVLPFVLGLLYDLFSGNPMGAMAFVLLLVSYLTSRLYEALGNDTALMAILVAAAALLAVEVIYGVLMLMFGYADGAMAALAYRALPSFVYDLVLSLILYPLVKRLLADSAPVQSSITRLR